MRIRYNVPTTFEEAVGTTGRFDRRGIAILDNPDETFRLLGIPLTIPALLAGREVAVERQERSLFVSVPAKQDEREQDLPGWRYVRRKWEHDIPNCFPEAGPTMYEERIRLTTDKYKAQAWVIKDARSQWKDQPLSAVRMFIKGFGHDDYEIAQVVQHHMNHNYQLTEIPFTEEELPDRIWNRFGARLSCTPMPGKFPHIQMILEHVGRNLQSAVEENDWCRNHGVANGAGYLKLWAAVIFRHPDRRLPGLFIWSPEQNIGKSSYGRMLTRGFLGENGWCELKKELTRDDFNDQMKGAALCLLEELDLSANFQAYQLVKNYIDNPHLKLRGIYSKAVTEPNYTHFIHTANYRHFCPVYPGDARLVLFRVDPYQGEDLTWKMKLCPLVDEEMPAFLYHLLHEIELPPSAGRLYLPVLETEDKRQAIAERMAEMQGWYEQLGEYARGGWIENKTAEEILQMLVGATGDPKLPKTAAAFANQLKQTAGRLKADGLILTFTEGDKKHPAKYTVLPLENKC